MTTAKTAATKAAKSTATTKAESNVTATKVFKDHRQPLREKRAAKVRSRAKTVGEVYHSIAVAKQWFLVTTIAGQAREVKVAKGEIFYFTDHVIYTDFAKGETVKAASYGTLYDNGDFVIDIKCSPGRPSMADKNRKSELIDSMTITIVVLLVLNAALFFVALALCLGVLFGFY